MSNESAPPYDVLMQAYDTLDKGGSLVNSVSQKLQHPGLRFHQLASLAVRLLDRDRNEAEETILRFVLNTQPQFRAYALSLAPEDPLSRMDAITEETQPPVQAINPSFANILRLTATKQRIGNEGMNTLIGNFMAGRIDETAMTVWLTSVCRFGMSFQDTLALTNAMAASGARYDYRDHPALAGKRLIRRYPTGGLSEKTALILPSLIASFGDEYPVATPFLIARSLGFTGGTWDKLMSIPGFESPHQGDETIQALHDSHCAMVVSKDDCNPADRLLYQLRSATGTVRSRSLAAASIASKQIVLPVHRLLLDVRYGLGAFFEREDAEGLGADVKDIVEQSNVACDLLFTDMEQPNGMAIGNAVEVQEALAIIRNDEKGWDPRALTEQRGLVIMFFAKLMVVEFSQHSEEQWARFAQQKFVSGLVAKAFGKILLTHHVPSDTVEEVMRNPASLTKNSAPVRDVVASRKGVLREIDQKQLGYLVNFHLGAGGNQYCEEIDRTSGVILKKRIGDAIDTGDAICRVFPGAHPERLTTEFEEKLLTCFTIA